MQREPNSLLVRHGVLSRTLRHVWMTQMTKDPCLAAEKITQVLWTHHSSKLSKTKAIPDNLRNLTGAQLRLFSRAIFWTEVSTVNKFPTLRVSFLQSFFGTKSMCECNDTTVVKRNHHNRLYLYYLVCERFSYRIRVTTLLTKVTIKANLVPSPLRRLGNQHQNYSLKNCNWNFSARTTPTFICAVACRTVWIFFVRSFTSAGKAVCW